MAKITDIRLGQNDSIKIDESFVLETSKVKSPHVIDLKNRPRLRHEHPDQLKDVKAGLAQGLKKGLTSQHNLYEEKYDPPVRIASRFSELARMMVLGLAVAFTLNAVGVYYDGLDLKEEIATAAYSSYESILEEGPSEDAFQAAEEIFQEAQQSLWFLQNQRQELLAQNKTALAVTNLLNAGEELSEAGGSFMTFVDNMRTISPELLNEKPGTGVSVSGKLKATYENDFTPAFNNLTSANDRIQTVRTGLFPADLQLTIEDAKSDLNELAAVLTQFDAIFPLLLELLGDEHPQRYLVLLENNNESRPGGGFIGSYLIVDLNDGYLDGMSFNDVYEIDGQYYKSIDPPGEIASLTNEWRFRDSNYSPDMAVSAAKGAWFLEEEGGPGVDHVITVDLEFVSRLLEITGPIKIDELPIALNHENFAMVMSFMVESKYSGIEAPKDVLGSFVSKMQDKLREQQPWLEMGQLLQEMAASKHVAAYSQDDEIHAFFDEFGITGGVATPAPREDHFLLVHTSIGGNKADAYTTQEIEHQTLIEEDGSLLNQVTVNRTHHWTELEHKRVKNLLSSFGFTDVPDWVVDILGGSQNTSIFRLYVPHGARLISTQGVEQSDIERQYDEALGLDYFYFPHTVYPSTTEEFTVTYELPFQLNFEPLDEYRLNVIKQPGDTDTTFTKTIVSDPRLNHYRSYPETFLENAHEERIGVYTYTTELNQDLHLAQLWGR